MCSTPGKVWAITAALAIYTEPPRQVVDQYNGEIPRDLDELRKLPGIGRYTLGAIASIAFGMDVSALDGNIKRVYARIFDIEEPVDSPAGEKSCGHWQINICQRVTPGITTRP